MNFNIELIDIAQLVDNNNNNNNNNNSIIQKEYNNYYLINKMMNWQA